MLDAVVSSSAHASPPDEGKRRVTGVVEVAGLADALDRAAELEEAFRTD